MLVFLCGCTTTEYVSVPGPTQTVFENVRVPGPVRTVTETVETPGPTVTVTVAPDPLPVVTEAIIPDADDYLDDVERPGLEQEFFDSCAEANANGYGPYFEGTEEYDHYEDRDNDGMVCEEDS